MDLNLLMFTGAAARRSLGQRETIGTLGSVDLKPEPLGLHLRKDSKFYSALEIYQVDSFEIHGIPQSRGQKFPVSISRYMLISNLHFHPNGPNDFGQTNQRSFLSVCRRNDQQALRPSEHQLGHLRTSDLLLSPRNDYLALGKSFLSYGCLLDK